MCTIRKIGVSFAVALVLFNNALWAATVTFSSPGVADSIIGLDVDGTFYDVSFIGNVSSTDWVSQFDFTNQTDATSAATAIAAALNNAGATSMLMQTTTGPQSQTFARVYYMAGVSDITGISASYAVGWNVGGNGTFNLDPNFFPFAYDFEPSAIPVPGALWLFGSALGLLGWLRHKMT